MNLKLKNMAFIILETHGGPEYAIVVTDEEGNNLVFESFGDAVAEAAGCQDGMVVHIPG
jgi:hypothetical protein